MLTRFGSRSPKPPAAVAVTPTDALSDAIKSFQNSLDPDQKARLEAIKAVPDEHAVAQFSHQLAQENAKRKSRCVAARISLLLVSVQQFTAIVETFVSSNPHIAALVWGSVKLVLQIASNFTTYFDNLSDLLMTIGKQCPRFQEYQKLYRDSTDLQKALCDFYSVVVRCCEQAVTVLRRTGYIQLLKAVTSSFNSDFDPILVQIDQASKEIDATIRLAEAKLNTTERQVQRAEREAAEKYRLSSIIHRKEREKFEADRMAQMQLEKSKIRQASILEQFSNYNYKVAYWTACTQRHGSTGQWLTQHNDFKRWIAENGPSVFWFTGILGSGKTVMTAFVVEQLSAKTIQTSEKLVYFFCQYDNETSLQATTVLRSIIRQLLDQDDRIYTKNESKIEALLDNLHDMGLLEALFSDIVYCLKSVVVILDGIDECSNSEMKLIVKTFRSIMLRKPSGLKLYLAGDDRITDIIMSSLTPSFVVNTHLPEAGSDLQELIKQLVTARKEDGDLVAGDPTLYQEIIDVLCAASQGMVLWVKFQLEEICSQRTDESIRGALSHLPKDLFETYNRLLSRVVKEGNEEVCAKIFRFMAAAKRPLSPEELGEAVSVEPCQPCFMPERLLNDNNGIARWCHGLIAFDDLDETLHFTHSSVKSFLCSPDTERITISGFHFKEHEADRQFGEICVTYLSFSDFETQIVKCDRPGALPDPMTMASHALGIGSSSIILNQAKNMISRRAKSVSTDSRLLSQHISKSKSQAMTRKYQLLQYVSEFWLFHTTELLPGQSRSWSLFRTLAEKRYPSIRGRPKALLSEDGLQEFMFSHEHRGLFALHMLQEWDDEVLYSNLASMLTFKCYSFLYLVALGSTQHDNNHDSRWQERILSLSDSDLFRIIKLSNLEWLEDLTITERSSILMKALTVVERLPQPIAIKLTELGVDPYHERDHYGKTTTLLEEVICQSNLTMLKNMCNTMVKSRADFSRKIARDGRNAFHIAAASRNSAALGVLMGCNSSRALINSTDDHGQTALHLAVQGRGRRTTVLKSDVVDVAKVLLEAGVSKMAKDASGKLAFEYASDEDSRSLHILFDEYPPRRRRGT